jgi:hypothetical protein
MEAFTTEDCSGSPLVETQLDYGECVENKNVVTVEELNNANFPFMKFSPDAKYEFYMFPNKESCKAYGNKFNPAVEVAFIRSPGLGCKECKQCGNIKSIKMTDVMMKKEGTTEVKEDSAASAVAASSAALVVSATFAMLF